MKNKSIKLVCEEIWKMEQKWNLLDTQINGLNFWKIIRFRVFLKITSQLKLYGDLAAPSSRRLLYILKKVSGSLLHTLFHTLPLKNRALDCLVLEHPRKILVDGSYRDTYTFDLVKELEEKNREFLILDPGFNGVHFQKAQGGRYFLDNVYLDFIYKTFLKRKKIVLSSSERELISNIENHIYSAFNINLDLLNIYKRESIEIKIQEIKFRKIFKYYIPKTLYLVCSYGKEGIIKTAQERGIKVTELQHGIISRYHLGYSFPQRDSAPYFPDEFLIFGDFWKDSLNIPLPDNQIRTVGYTHFNRLIKDIDVQKDSKRILILSQWVIGQKLADMVLQLSNEMPEYQFIFRLHPSQRSNWKSAYRNLAENPRDNIIVDDIGPNLYEEIAKSSYVIGVFSTAVYEALCLNARMIIMQYPGSEYLEYLDEKGVINFCATAEDVQQAIKNNTFKPVDREYFFKSGESFLP